MEQAEPMDVVASEEAEPAIPPSEPVASKEPEKAEAMDVIITEETKPTTDTPENKVEDSKPETVKVIPPKKGPRKVRAKLAPQIQPPDDPKVYLNTFWVKCGKMYWPAELRDPILPPPKVAKAAHKENDLLLQYFGEGKYVWANDKRAVPIHPENFAKFVTNKLLKLKSFKKAYDQLIGKEPPYWTVGEEKSDSSSEEESEEEEEEEPKKRKRAKPKKEPAKKKRLVVSVKLKGKKEEKPTKEKPKKRARDEKEESSKKKKKTSSIVYKDDDGEESEVEEVDDVDQDATFALGNIEEVSDDEEEVIPIKPKKKGFSIPMGLSIAKYYVLLQSAIKKGDGELAVEILQHLATLPATIEELRDSGLSKYVRRVKKSHPTPRLQELAAALIKHWEKLFAPKSEKKVEEKKKKVDKEVKPEEVKKEVQPKPERKVLVKPKKKVEPKRKEEPKKVEPKKKEEINQQLREEEVAVGKVREIQDQLQQWNSSKDADAVGKMVALLETLTAMGKQVTVRVMQTTGIGKTVKKLRKTSAPEVVKVATNLYTHWKAELSREMSSTTYASTGTTGGGTVHDRAKTMLAEVLTRDLYNHSSENVRIAAVLRANEMAQAIVEEVEVQKRMDFNRNEELRSRLVAGKVFAAAVVKMSPDELVPQGTREAIQQRAEELRQQFLKDVNYKEEKATTDQFKCEKCGQRKTTYYQLQTRSADEPATTYVTCVADGCGNRWKFC